MVTEVKNAAAGIITRFIVWVALGFSGLLTIGATTIFDSRIKEVTACESRKVFSSIADSILDSCEREDKVLRETLFDRMDQQEEYIKTIAVYMEYQDPSGWLKAKRARRLD